MKEDVDLLPVIEEESETSFLLHPTSLALVLPCMDQIFQSKDLKRKARAERFGIAQSAPADEEAKKKAKGTHLRSLHGIFLDQDYMADLHNQMMNQFHDINDPDKAIYRTLKEVSRASSLGSRAMKQVSQKIQTLAVKAAGQDASVAALRKLAEEWKELSRKQSSIEALRGCLKSFRGKVQLILFGEETQKEKKAAKEHAAAVKASGNNK
ncbi:unnamed protein product [Fraxinus pennsylvanica]|uniref:Uncharacterized protein n=1 Tax=Fraxinus pennsylvanica TaxID=56036 RepID=A0AAD1ZB98_9LAMI|nr:unnamed protein product [Fraxinus pennsylvanica]